MSFFFDGREVKDGFDLVCVAYELDGALGNLMRKIYIESGEDLGAVQNALLEMGHEGMKKEVLEHTWADLRERETIANIGTKPERREIAAKNAKALKEALVLGIRREREGD